MSTSLVKTKVDALAPTDPDNLGIPDNLHRDWKKSEEFRRGRKLIPASEATQIARERLDIFDYGIRWGSLVLPSYVAPTHFCVVGAIGSGKTTIQRLLMQSVLPLIGAEHKTKPREEKHTEIVRPTPDEIRLHEQAVAKAEESYQKALKEYEERRARLADSHQKATGQYKRELDALQERLKPNRTWALRCLIGAAVGGGLVTAGNFLYGTHPNSALGFTGFLLSRPGWALMGYGPFLAVAIYGYGKYAKGKLRPPVLAPDAYPERTVLTPPAPKTVKRTELVATSPRGDGHRALIYDAKGDIISLLHGMGVQGRIHILNPLDSRCAAWDMAKDVKTPSAAQQLAETLIPKNEKASQPFFSNSARLLLTQVFMVLMQIKPDEWTFRDVVVAMRTKESLMELLSRTPTSRAEAQGVLGGAPGTTDNVFSEIKSQMAQYEVIAALWSNAKSKVSLREWTTSESIVVLGNCPEFRAALDPINRVMFKLASDFTLAQTESKTRRSWFLLDEIREAGNLDSLKSLMNLGRSKGACVVLGFQDVEGMQDAFGEKQANELLGQANNKAILRVNSPQTAKWASELFGKYEVTEQDSSVNRGGNRTQGSTDTTGETTGQTITKGSTSGSSFSSNHSKAGQTSTNTSVAKNSSETETWAETINRKRVEKDAVLASEIQSMHSTDEINGLPGYYLVPTIGAFYDVLPGRLFDELLLPPSDDEPNFEEREVADQYLTPWTDAERKALGLSDISEPEKEKDKEASDDTPDASKASSKPPPRNIDKNEPRDATEEERNKLFAHLPHARPKGAVSLNNDL